MTRVLVARLDNAGDVLLAGPAVRAAASVGEVTLLCGPAGVDAALLLPGVADVVVWEAPWVGFQSPPVDRTDMDWLVQEIARAGISQAAVLTSFHQSPLPLALLLRLAGVEEIAAVSVDFPGTLLDHRIPYRTGLHEVEQSLEVTSALRWPYPLDDRLAINGLTESKLAAPYVVVHPGASVPARALPPRLTADLLGRLEHEAIDVVVTGSRDEREDMEIPVRPFIHDLRGRTSFSELAGVVAGAESLICGNTGPAHVAAAVGTPVVSVFAPVVPLSRWRPWRVPSVVLGNQDISCAGCRSRACPLPTQQCVEDVDVEDVLAAWRSLTGRVEVSRR